MEKYTKKQAEDEASVITERLSKEYSNQEGNFSKEQYDQAHKQEADEIYKTAIGTVEGLAIFTDIEPAKQIWKLLGGTEENESFSRKTAGKPHLVELRYKTSDKVIRDLAETENVRQIVELASGFTPHAQELLSSNVVGSYIESDLPINTAKKREINTTLNPDLPIAYAPGNVYDHEVWVDIESKLKEGPILVFSEGFMLYTTKAERDKLSDEVKLLLENHGGHFMFEDSTRFHPEFISHPNFKPFFDKLSQGSNRDLGAISQEEMTREWEERGFVVERVPEDVDLSSEDQLPELVEEIDLIKKNYKMWKLSLKS